MPQPRDDEGFRRNFCTSCGAKIRARTSFCISCGASLALNTETPASTQDAVALDSEYEPEGGAGSTRPAQGEPQAARPIGPSADNLYGAEANTASKFLNRVINWFRNLSSVPKLILVGLLLLLLLTVLSPIARVVAIIAFVVSAALFVIRAIRREPIKGWGIAALASFVLIFVFGGISSLVYGFGSSAPGYEVVQEGSLPLEGDSGSVDLVFIASDSLDEEQLQTIAEDMIPRTEDHDVAAVNVYDRDEAYYGDGVQSVGTETPYSGDMYEITIAHTSLGERVASVKAQVGRYTIERVPGPGNPDTEDYNDFRYYDYEEAGTGTNDIGANEAGSPSGDSAGVLASMIRGGMMDGDQAIEDVRISGESAVVVVASDVSGGYAQSVCDFALEAALSYDNQSGYGDSVGITQVSVKKPWRPWNETVCSL